MRSINVRYSNLDIGVLLRYTEVQPRLQGALSLKPKGPLKGVNGNRGSLN